jgi:hypothetical protein
VPALGEHSDREIATAINDFQEENAPGIVKVPEEPPKAVTPPPKRKIVLKKPTPAPAAAAPAKEDPFGVLHGKLPVRWHDQYPKLAELEEKAMYDSTHSPRRLYVALAKLLIVDKKMGQGPLGRKLAEMGFSGTTQSNISKKISQMRDMGLLKPMNQENGWYPLVA